MSNHVMIKSLKCDGESVIQFIPSAFCGMQNTVPMDDSHSQRPPLFFKKKRKVYLCMYCCVIWRWEMIPSFYHMCSGDQSEAFTH